MFKWNEATLLNGSFTVIVYINLFDYSKGKNQAAYYIV